MSTAKSLPLPKVENLPFINTWFTGAGQKMEEQIHPMDGDLWPGVICNDLIEALDRFDPEVLKTLLTALRPHVNKDAILSREDLASAAIKNGSSYREYFVEEGDFDDFTDEQLQVWLLQSASYPRDTDWRKVISLFNESSADQQDAIDNFFWEFRRFSLDTCASARGMELNVPESLYANETRVIDGETQVFCHLAKDWLSDDKFYTQIEVIAIDGLTGKRDCIGYTGTIEQAVAKATLYTLGLNGFVLDPGTNEPKTLNPDAVSRQSGKIVVKFGSAIIANAELKRRVEQTTDLKTVLDCKLAWGESTKGPISSEQFRRTLWATEKLLGVNWSKVRHLENDLGM